MQNRQWPTAMTALWEGEFPATVQVLAAVNDSNRDYKPDAEVADGVGAGDAPGDGRHLVPATASSTASSSGIPRRPRQAEAQFKSVNDIVEFYKKTFPTS